MKKRTARGIYSFIAAVFSALTFGGLFLRRKMGKKREEAEQKAVSWKQTLLWTVVSGLISSFSKLLISETSRKAERRFQGA